MHCLLLSIYPFWDQNSKEYNQKVCNLALGLDLDSQRANLSNECKDLLRQMLSKNVAERASIDEVLLHPWFKL